jgi:cytoskeletal protein CcmA (bactofilin family)
MNLSSNPDTKIPASVIAAELEVVGDLVSNGTLIIEGRVEGKASAAELTVAEGAHLTGEFRSEIALIAGDLSGRIHSRIVRITGTARVDGIIEQTVLNIADGAEIQGTVVRLHEAPAPRASSVPD